MSPLYTHCPHYEFPCVVEKHARSFPRYCRQCGRRYVPPKPKEDDPSRRRRHEANARKARPTTLRALIRAAASRKSKRLTR